MSKFYYLEDMTQEELNNLALERNNLEKENQQLKKQKADVVEDIKKQITSCTNEAEGTVNNDKCWMAVNYLKKLLRMLGEK